MYRQYLQPIKQALAQVPAKCNAIGEMAPENKISDGLWTRKVKEAIASVAKDNNSAGTNRIYANNCDLAEDGGNEWLFDLVWAIETGQDNWELERLLLVMESEWNRNPDNQRYDFQKLLVARAAIKVFVFQEPDRENHDEKIHEFTRMLKAYKNNDEDEIYFFAGLLYANKGSEEFQFSTFDGKGAPFDLRQA